MKKMRKLAGIVLLALVATLGTPQAFAGAVETAGVSSTGPTEVPGVTADGTAESPGITAMILDLLAVLF
jgi:hypothetical protein